MALSALIAIIRQAERQMEIEDNRNSNQDD